MQPNTAGLANSGSADALTPAQPLWFSVGLWRKPASPIALLPYDSVMTEEAPVTGDQQTWRVLAHASAFVQLFGIPSVIGPLVVWLVRREDPVVEPHAREALNFQLSLLIYFIGGVVIGFLAAITIVGLVVTVFIIIALIVLFLLELIFALLGAIAASRGELYRYPMNLNLIKS